MVLRTHQPLHDGVADGPDTTDGRPAGRIAGQLATWIVVQGVLLRRLENHHEAMKVGEIGELVAVPDGLDQRVIGGIGLAHYGTRESPWCWMPCRSSG